MSGVFGPSTSNWGRSVCLALDMDWIETRGVRWRRAELGPAGPGTGWVGFGSRVGGVSEAPYDSLNVGVLTGDLDAALIENRGRLAAAVGTSPSRVPIGLQGHKAAIAAHQARQGAGGGGPPPAAPPGSKRPPPRSAPESAPAATRSAPRSWRSSPTSATG